MLLVVLGVEELGSVLASQALLIILLEVGLVGDLPGRDFSWLFSILVLVVWVGVKEFILLHGGIRLVWLGLVAIVAVIELRVLSLDSCLPLGQIHIVYLISPGLLSCGRSPLRH